MKRTVIRNETRVRVTLPPSDHDAKASRLITEHFVERYQKATSRLEAIVWDAFIHDGAAQVWANIGEDAESASSTEQAERLADQMAQLEEEIERLSRALKHLEVDPASL